MLGQRYFPEKARILGLGRVSIEPDPDRFCTNAAKGTDVLFWANARSRHKII